MRRKNQCSHKSWSKNLCMSQGIPKKCIFGEKLPATKNKCKFVRFDENCYNGTIAVCQNPEARADANRRKDDSLQDST